MTADVFKNWQEEAVRSGTIAPARIGMLQQEVLTLFGKPSRVSITKKKGKPLILKYDEVEFHFDPLNGHRLSRVYSDDADGNIRLCIPPA